MPSNRLCGIVGRSLRGRRLSLKSRQCPLKRHLRWLVYADCCSRDRSSRVLCATVAFELGCLYCGTAQVLAANERGTKFVVLSNPEFLAEGTAMKDLENPGTTVL